MQGLCLLISSVAYVTFLYANAGVWTLVGYANIMNVETTGASANTASQDKLSYSGKVFTTRCSSVSNKPSVQNPVFCEGVPASETMAHTDAGRMAKYKTKINSAAAAYGIDPALVAAIISRESRAGNVLIDGWGDHGHAWGLMQVVSSVAVFPSHPF